MESLGQPSCFGPRCVGGLPQILRVLTQRLWHHQPADLLSDFVPNNYGMDVWNGRCTKNLLLPGGASRSDGQNE